MISDLARHRCDDEALAGCCDQDPLTNMVSASQICIDCAIIFVAQTQPRSSRHGQMFDLETAPNSSTAENLWVFVFVLVAHLETIEDCEH